MPRGIDFDRLVQVFILLGICGWIPGMTQAGFQLAILDFGGPLLFAAFLFSGEDRAFTNIGLGALIVACIWTSVCINAGEYPIMFIHILAGCLAYYAIVSGVQDSKSIMRVLVFIGVINMVVALFQKIGYDPIYVPDPANCVIQQKHLSMAGLMGRNYHLGYMLAVTAPLALFLDIGLGIAYNVVAAAFIFMIGSFAGMLVFGITLLFALSRWVNRWILASVIAVAVSLIGIFFWQDIVHKIHWRVPAYFCCVRESFVNPFVGHGLNSFQQLKNFDSSFNIVFKFMYELGLIPTIFLLLAIIKHFRAIHMPYRTIMASAAALCTYTMFHDTTIFSRLMILSMAVLAIYEIEGCKKIGGYSHG